ncbi:hypothetical protein [Vibrio parahaemolyticus]|uniref:hypothetical protein n=1 Tax=Vibrio parahaemolyticus TaxID=670 RepID=UPI001D59F432|nr:hypothetical protein [Vibrio parahaemolyticus]EHY0996459.1 hypothetical protein [Vibrio parahaemolyticus]MCR9667033.1 hypothetical protein [Vibrio parahaemolyticus]MCR9823420.1 hypothetical protein [Vibrio parahaemolyticus]
MSKITNKDIESFGKVLGALSELCINNPQLVSGLIASSDVYKKDKQVQKEDISPKAQEFNVFQTIKEQSRKDAIASLSVFNKTELKFIIKSNSLGSTRLNTVDSLAEFIVDTVSKRTEDVFLNQQDRI